VADPTDGGPTEDNEIAIAKTGVPAPPQTTDSRSSTEKPPATPVEISIGGATTAEN
jgi:hypothetical protein